MPQIRQPTSTSTSASAEHTRDDALLAALVLGSLLGLLATRWAALHPLQVALATGMLAMGCASALVVHGRVRDRLAARRDPPSRGLVIGTRRGDWPLARPRPYVLAWHSFRQHVLITGPTGRGKSFGFIDPILRAHVNQPGTGVLYMDGKGDRIDTGSRPVRFDHVFCPEDPSASASWNPLAGPDPIAAARSFADALFPSAALPDAVYYEVRGAFAIRAVAPAIAYTGHGLPSPPGADHDTVLAELVAHGIPEDDAAYLISYKGLDACADQLRWLPTRRRQGAGALLEYIHRNSRPASSIDHQLLMPPAARTTIAALHHVLFTEGELAVLADRLDTQLDDDLNDLARERLGLLAAQIRSLAALPPRELAGVLSNLENRLATFLTPPFDRLCATSDFSLSDVCAGASIAMLLPTGSFPGIAEPLGRAALSQFQQAVLASQPDRTKIAVLDEFHNFVSPAFTKFLSQARSRGGAAVMSTQTIADFHPDYRDRLLANASTQIITPGALPFDADHWSKAFGEHPTEHRSETHQPRGLLEPRSKPTVRIELRDAPRYTPTAVTELPAGQALIRQVAGRTAYPAMIVDIERRDARP